MSNAVIAYGGVAVMAIGFALALMLMLKAWASIAAVSATISAALYQLFVYVNLGHYDPFTPIAFMMSWLYAFVLASITVLAARKVRSGDSTRGPDRGST